MSAKKSSGKELSVGEKHVKRLGIRAINSQDRLEKEGSRIFGNGFLDIVHRIQRDSNSPDYDVKNSDYDIAMFYSGAYDYHIIVKACDWISEHKECFGKKILEIGCDCGFMTTFLATQFPDCHIVSIDREKNGLEIAKKNCEKFGVTNVEFIQSDLMDLEYGKFDTVFSMRTLSVNIYPKIKDDKDWHQIQYSDRFSVALENFSAKLSSMINENGTFVSIERLWADFTLLGWIKAQKNAGLSVSSEDHAELICRELGEKITLQALIGTKKNSDQDLCEVFMECFKHHTDTHLGRYFGYEADVMCEYTGRSMLSGYMIKNLNTGDVFRA